jgi:drug/metabolite transporter (DMT)-like permease
MKNLYISRWAADLSLATATFFWGVTFVIVKDAVSKASVFFFLTQRFVLAAILLVLICLVLKRPLSWREIRYGLVMGFFLFGCFAFQTSALLYTTATNTAFLTGLYVVFTPIFESVLFKKPTTRYMASGVVLATAGLYFLCNDGIAWSFNKGDLLAFLCAIGATLHIIFTGRYAPKGDVFWMTAVQIGTVGVLSLFAAGLQHQNVFVYKSEIRSALIICVLFATVFAFLIQTSMQRFTSPAQAALIFCLEPVFAAVYAHFTINETLGWIGISGAVLILAGMIVSELGGVQKKEPVGAELPHVIP